MTWDSAVAGVTRVVCAALALVGVGVARPAAAQYLATDLNPPGFDSSRPSSIVGGQIVGFGYPAGTFDFHALFWSGAGASALDITPPDYTAAVIQSGDGAQEGGYGHPTAHPFDFHPLLWSAGSANAMDLMPGGFNYAVIRGVGGGEQVGEGNGPATSDPIHGSPNHALLWHGTANATDLNPNGFWFSTAAGVWNGQQVGGGGGDATGNVGHALLWSGTPGSVMDLNPSNLGIAVSAALGIENGQEVGYGWGPNPNDNMHEHALLWTGTADSAVDLSSAAYARTYALATNGVQQVGYGGNTPNFSDAQALLWSGSPGSVVDLNAFLPAGFTQAYAVGIDSNGDIVGWASGPASGNQDHLILWTPVTGAAVAPEPSAVALFVCGVLSLLAFGTHAWRRGARYP